MAFAQAENLARLHLLLKLTAFLGSTGHVVGSGFYKGKKIINCLIKSKKRSKMVT